MPTQETIITCALFNWIAIQFWVWVLWLDTKIYSIPPPIRPHSYLFWFTAWSNMVIPLAPHAPSLLCRHHCPVLEYRWENGERKGVTVTSSFFSPFLVFRPLRASVTITIKSFLQKRLSCTNLEKEYII